MSSIFKISRAFFKMILRCIFAPIFLHSRSSFLVSFVPSKCSSSSPDRHIVSPLPLDGHLKRPFSKRFKWRKKPSPSHSRIFNISRDLFRTRIRYFHRACSTQNPTPPLPLARLLPCACPWNRKPGISSRREIST